MKFYNTLTRKKEEFKEIAKGHVKIYSCGPTVYNYAHIGNWRAFIFADVLRRYLRYSGYKVLHVMNLTDVDDKTIRDSQKEGVSLKEFTERYTKIFFQDRDTLNIEPVEHYPKATESIKEMLDITKDLIKKGIAYKSEDGSTYYSVSKFKGYGKLSKVEVDSLKSGARVKNDEYEKGSANDFALWKAYEKEDGEVFWDTDLGKGRPGWHIECSAMSTKFLGKHFDIHTGGIDLIFPHHENEIAQSEGCFDEQFVNYWLHSEHLLVDNEKMSKSKGNFFVLKDILAKGYSPRAVRYLLLGTHYRQKLNFTFSSLESSEIVVQKLKEFILRLKRSDGKSSDVASIIEQVREDFKRGMDDDLNVSEVLSSVFEFTTQINKLMADDMISKKNAEECLSFVREMDLVLGIFDFQDDEVPEEVMELVEARAAARKMKDFKEADKLRDEIKALGYEIDDSGKGTLVKKI